MARIFGLGILFLVFIPFVHSRKMPSRLFWDRSLVTDFQGKIKPGQGSF